MISLAHGTLLHLAPPELIRVAAASGFDAVGLRTLPGDVERYALRSTRAPLES